MDIYYEVENQEGELLGTFFDSLDIMHFLEDMDGCDWSDIVPLVDEMRDGDTLSIANIFITCYED